MFNKNVHRFYICESLQKLFIYYVNKLDKINKNQKRKHGKNKKTASNGLVRPGPHMGKQDTNPVELSATVLTPRRCGPGPGRLFRSYFLLYVLFYFSCLLFNVLI
jgi:hypothetical protein